jgi:hypothetical protein
VAKQTKLKEEREYVSSGGRPGEDPSYENVVQSSKGLKATGVDPKDFRKALKAARRLGLQRRTK